MIDKFTFKVYYNFIMKQPLKELKNLPQTLYNLRTINNFTQGEVALRLGISYQSYQGYEHGKTVPTLENFIKIANLYGISLDYLINKK